MSSRSEGERWGTDDWRLETKCNGLILQSPLSTPISNRSLMEVTSRLPTALADRRTREREVERSSIREDRIDMSLRKVTECA